MPMFSVALLTLRDSTECDKAGRARTRPTSLAPIALVLALRLITAFSARYQYNFWRPICVKWLRYTDLEFDRSI